MTKKYATYNTTEAPKLGFFRRIGRWIKRVVLGAGRGIATAAKAVGRAAKATGKAFYAAIKATGRGIWAALRATGRGLLVAAKATGRTIWAGTKAVGRGLRAAAKATKRGILYVGRPVYRLARRVVPFLLFSAAFAAEPLITLGVTAAGAVVFVVYITLTEMALDSDRQGVKTVGRGMKWVWRAVETAAVLGFIAFWGYTISMMAVVPLVMTTVGIAVYVLLFNGTTTKRRVDSASVAQDYGDRAEPFRTAPSAV